MERFIWTSLALVAGGAVLAYLLGHAVDRLGRKR